MTEPVSVVSILYLNPRKFGSMEEYTVALSSALRQRGARSVLVFSAPPAAAIAPQFADCGAQIEALPHPGAPANTFALWRLLRRHRADLVHFHFVSPFSLLPLVAKAAGARAVLFTEHTRVPKTLGPALKLALRLWDRLVLAPLGVRLFGVSDHVTRILSTCYAVAPRRIRTLHNGVNLARFVKLDEAERARMRGELDLPAGAQVALCAAYLIPQKGVDDLLRAARHVVAATPEAYFVIVGDGPMAAELKALAASLGIAERVRFTGLRSDVQRLMGMADVVVVPSVWQEPAGLVAVEAMATERPVVACRVGGLPELVADGETGRVVAPQSPEQLAGALNALLGDAAERARLGRAGRARVERLFSMQRWIDDTVAACADALGPRGRSLSGETLNAKR